jgi:hypothetical protein
MPGNNGGSIDSIYHPHASGERAPFPVGLFFRHEHLHLAHEMAEKHPPLALGLLGVVNGLAYGAVDIPATHLAFVFIHVTKRKAET